MKRAILDDLIARKENKNKKPLILRSAKKFTFKDAVAGVNRYDRLAGVSDWLEKAGLIIKVSIANSGNLPFSAYAKENTFKLFLFDIGISGTLSSLVLRFKSYDEDFAKFYSLSLAS